MVIFLKLFKSISKFARKLYYLKADLKDGQFIKLTRVFEPSGRIKIFSVEIINLNHFNSKIKIVYQIKKLLCKGDGHLYWFYGKDFSVAFIKQHQFFFLLKREKWFRVLLLVLQ